MPGDGAASSFEIDKLPIFETGKWNGDQYSEEDLDHMVQAFPLVGFKPPLKLGHANDQKILQSSGLPSAGWIERIYREGTKLYADIKDIPKQVYDLISKKAYDRVSVELYWNYDDSKTGVKHPRVVKALALLGADIPEVTSLESISSLYYDDDKKSFKIIMFNNEGKEGGTMPEEDKKEDKKYEKEIKELTAKLQEMSKLEGKITEMSAKLDIAEGANKTMAENLMSERKARKADQVKEKVKNYIQQKKILPAQAQYVEGLLNAIGESEITVSFSKDDKIEEKKFSAEAAIDNFLGLQPAVIGDEKTREGVGTGDLDGRIRAYCKENDLKYESSEGYRTALKAVGKEI